jgi:hypothetical protein
VVGCLIFAMSSSTNYDDLNQRLFQSPSFIIHAGHGEHVRRLIYRTIKRSRSGGVLGKIDRSLCLAACRAEKRQLSVSLLICADRQRKFSVLLLLDGRLRECLAAVIVDSCKG